MEEYARLIRYGTNLYDINGEEPNDFSKSVKKAFKTDPASCLWVKQSITQSMHLTHDLEGRKHWPLQIIRLLVKLGNDLFQIAVKSITRGTRQPGGFVAARSAVIFLPEIKVDDCWLPSSREYI